MSDEQRIIGFIEAISDRGIAGWAFRPGDMQPLRLSLIVDGADCGEIVCGRPRDDVWARRPEFHPICTHGPRLGFLAPIPPAYFDGEPHRFTLVADTGEVVSLRTIGRPPEWEQQFTLATLGVLGLVEPGGEGQPVFGWAVVIDRRTGAKRVGNQIAVTSSTGATARLVAAAPRPDVARFLNCDPHCGFSFLPTAEMLGELPAELHFSVLPERIELPRSPVTIEAPRRPAPPPLPLPEEPAAPAGQADADDVAPVSAEHADEPVGAALLPAEAPSHPQPPATETEAVESEPAEPETSSPAEEPASAEEPATDAPVEPTPPPTETSEPAAAEAPESAPPAEVTPPEVTPAEVTPAEVAPVVLAPAEPVPERAAWDDSELADLVPGDARDPDDTRIAFTAVPRKALFGIAPRLDALRARLLVPDTAKEQSRYPSDPERTIVREFDRDFYLDTYPDVRASGVDPVVHYAQAGWTEGRRPAPWFDSAYYLAANPDIKDAGVNPFWHYLLIGREEGRAPERAGGYRRGIIENLVTPDMKTAHYQRAAAVLKLLPDHLEKRVHDACAAARGLVLSVSHDCYIRSTGGIQLFIDDEQRAFQRRGLSYLNISPLDPDLVLAGDASRGLVRVVLDGVLIGTTSYEDLAAVLSRRPREPGEQRLFTVHCLLGHHVERLTQLQHALGAGSNYFWLHDFSSLCAGFNLLRNDVAFCDAPPIDSDSCRVCVYGESRRTHLARLHRFFDAVPFTVVSPSRAALDIWRRGTTLPHLDSIVHPHCHVDRNAERTSLLAGDDDTTPPVIRVAYVGYAVAHKGWPVFQELVNRTGRMGCYRFYHFVSASGAPERAARIEQVHVQTAPGQRDAMSEALAAHGIDIVMMLSPWPETFSYVTFEALAAGTDIVALADSGNVADVVLTQGRGIVAQNEDAIYEMFENLRVLEYVRLRGQQGIAAGTLVHAGTTATIDGALLPEASR